MTSSASWIRAARRSLAKRSIENFCRIYLGRHFSTEFGEHHLDLFAAIDNRKPNKRVCRAEPRQFGKTTVVGLALPLSELAFQRKNFIILLGESGPAAEGNLQAIIDEVENNELLLEDFPHLAPERDVKGQLTKWTDRELAFASGARVLARGMRGSLRGLKRKRFRPDLAVLDDPESPENSDTFAKRKKNKRWFGGTFYGLGAKLWDIYVIGNLVDDDSLLAELLKSKEWDSKVYKAENLPPREKGSLYPIGNTKTDGSALWEAEWPIERLRDYKRQPNVGALNYSREMLNEPRAEGDKVFDSAGFVFFDFNRLELATRYDATATFVDPAGGAKPSDVKAGRKDYAAIVTVGRTRITADSPEAFLEVIDARLTKKLPDKQIDLLLDVYEELGPSIIAAEENMYKNLLKSNIERQGRERKLFPPIKAVTQSQNKVSRIMSLQPIAAAGTLRFARHLLKSCPELFEQFDEFPNPSAHDDGPDAVEGAVRLLEKRRWAPV